MVAASGARRRRSEEPRISHAAPHASQEIAKESHTMQRTEIGDISYGHFSSFMSVQVGQTRFTLERRFRKDVRDPWLASVSSIDAMSAG